MAVDVEAVAESLVEAFNARDLDAVLALVAERVARRSCTRISADSPS
jgi:hypothetical protein